MCGSGLSRHPRQLCACGCVRDSIPMVAVVGRAGVGDERAHQLAHWRLAVEGLFDAVVELFAALLALVRALEMSNGVGTDLHGGDVCVFVGARLVKFACCPLGRAAAHGPRPASIGWPRQGPILPSHPMAGHGHFAWRTKRRGRVGRDMRRLSVFRPACCCCCCCCCCCRCRRSPYHRGATVRVRRGV